MSEDPSLKITEVAKVLGNLWKNLTSDEKLVYSKQSKDEGEKYALKVDHDS